MGLGNGQAPQDGGGRGESRGWTGWKTGVDPSSAGSLSIRPSLLLLLQPAPTSLAYDELHAAVLLLIAPHVTHVLFGRGVFISTWNSYCVPHVRPVTVVYARELDQEGVKT